MDNEGSTLSRNTERRAMVRLESILERDNLNKAMRQVIANKGSAGIDGMEVAELHPYLKAHHPEITKAIREGKYKPSPVRRVQIPKEERGKTRPLGIPTVIDRFIQQAVAQRLSQAYEQWFSPNSHGFRPDRGCHTAINQALAYANSGKRWVVDLDLEKFFDTVNHAKLIQVLSERIKDGRVISLIHKMLRAPVSENGKVTKTEIGTPQGGCISPVLANILLNELDQELDRRGHAFVRYADDMMVMCGSKKAAQRVYQSLRTFIEDKLKLKVNEQKSKICYINASELKFLGYGFYIDKEGVVKARVHQKSYEKCKRKLRELTSRSKGQSLDTYRERLSYFIRGWVNYFKLASMKSWVQETDQWLRRRIRQIYWKQWKTVSMRSRALRQLGMSKEKAWEWANTRKAYWRVAGSHILSTTLTSDFLKARGWMCLKVAMRAALR